MKNAYSIFLLACLFTGALTFSIPGVSINVNSPPSNLIKPREIFYFSRLSKAQIYLSTQMSWIPLSLNILSTTTLSASANHQKKTT